MFTTLFSPVLPLHTFYSKIKTKLADGYQMDMYETSGSDSASDVLR